jgi:hypothetical protein
MGIPSTAMVCCEYARDDRHRGLRATDPDGVPVDLADELWP